MTIATPTVAEVRVVIVTALDDAGVQATIDDAALLVEVCPGVVSASEARQKAIVKWVTAHLLSQRSGTAGPLSSRSHGDASESYAAGFRTFGMALTSSFYGQQAIMLDDSGCLRTLGQVKARFRVLGGCS